MKSSRISNIESVPVFIDLAQSAIQNFQKHRFDSKNSTFESMSVDIPSAPDKAEEKDEEIEELLFQDHLSYIKSVEDMQHILKQFDKLQRNGSQGMTQDEFVEGISSALERGFSRDQLIETFKKIDANCDGTVTSDEFVSYLLSLQEALSLASEESQIILKPIKNRPFKYFLHENCIGLFTNSNRIYSIFDSGRFIVCNSNAQLISEYKHEARSKYDTMFTCGCISPQYVFTATLGRFILVFDMNGELKHTLGPFKYTPTAMCWVSNHLFIGDSFCNLLSLPIDFSKTNTTPVMRQCEKTKLFKRDISINVITPVPFLLSSIALGLDDGTLCIVDCLTLSIRMSKKIMSSTLHDIAIDHLHKFLLVSGVSRDLYVVDAYHGEIHTKVGGHDSGIRSITVSDDLILTLTFENSLRLFDLHSFAPHSTFLLDGQGYKVGYEPNTNVFIASCPYIQTFSLENTHVAATTDINVSFSLFCNTFGISIVVSIENIAFVFKGDTGLLSIRFRPCSDLKLVDITGGVLDFAQRRLFLARSDGNIGVYNFHNGATLATLKGYDKPLIHLTMVGVDPLNHTYKVTPDEFLRAETNFIVAFTEDEFVVWRDPISTPFRRFSTKKKVSGICCCGANRFLCVTTNGCVFCVNATSGVEVYTEVQHPNLYGLKELDFESIFISARSFVDGKRYYAALFDCDGVVHILSTSDMDFVAMKRLVSVGVSPTVFNIRVKKESIYMFVGTAIGTVRVWKLDLRGMIFTQIHHFKIENGKRSILSINYHSIMGQDVLSISVRQGCFLHLMDGSFIGRYGEHNWSLLNKEDIIPADELPSAIIAREPVNTLRKPSFKRTSASGRRHKSATSKIPNLDLSLLANNKQSKIDRILQSARERISTPREIPAEPIFHLAPAQTERLTRSVEVTAERAIRVLKDSRDHIDKDEFTGLRGLTLQAVKSVIPPSTARARLKSSKGY
ncbi:hypothetical protein PCE1_001948 [Barthelona sp. PCE]